MDTKIHTKQREAKIKSEKSHIQNILGKKTNKNNIHTKIPQLIQGAISQEDDTIL